MTLTPDYRTINSQSQAMTQSVYNEPVKSRLRILFCCRIESSPMVRRSSPGHSADYSDHRPAALAACRSAGVRSQLGTTAVTQLFSIRFVVRAVGCLMSLIAISAVAFTKHKKAASICVVYAILRVYCKHHLDLCVYSACWILTTSSRRSCS